MEWQNETRLKLIREIISHTNLSKVHYDLERIMYLTDTSEAGTRFLEYNKTNYGDVLVSLIKSVPTINK